MKTQELRGLTAEELRQKLSGLKRELFDLRMLAAGGKLDKPHRMNLIRKDSARILTLIREFQKQPAPKALLKKGRA